MAQHLWAAEHDTCKSMDNVLDFGSTVDVEQQVATRPEQREITSHHSHALQLLL